MFLFLNFVFCHFFAALEFALNLGSSALNIYTRTVVFRTSHPGSKTTWHHLLQQRAINCRIDSEFSF